MLKKTFLFCDGSISVQQDRFIYSFFLSYKKNIFGNSHNVFYLRLSNFLWKKKFYRFNVYKKYCQLKVFSLLVGFSVILEIIGLGFSVTVKAKILRMNIGYNHSIFYIVPMDVIVKSKRKILYLFSYSFFRLKCITTDIKNFRLLSPYKLKGIKLKNELYSKKNWKKNIN